MTNFDDRYPGAVLPGGQTPGAPSRHGRSSSRAKRIAVCVAVAGAALVGLVVIVGANGGFDQTPECIQHDFSSAFIGEDPPQVEWAVRAPDRDAQGYTPDPRWYIASATGGVWATDIDPTGRLITLGLVTPLNQQAADESVTGIDIFGVGSFGPFADMDDTSEEAQAVLACARDNQP